MQGARCRVDSELSHNLGYVESSFLALECLMALKKVLHFGGDQGDVGAEGVLGKTELDKLDKE